MVIRRLVASALVVALPVAAAAQSVPPEMAAPPRTLLAANGEPVDDTDVAAESEDETLAVLNQIEIDKDAWSTGAAVGLSAIPGGGFGLIYADKPAASVVPFLLSVAGFAVGALYIAGKFDTKKKTNCFFKADPSGTAAGTEVDSYRCSYALFTGATDDPIAGDEDDNPNPAQNTGERTTHSFDWTATDKSRVGTNKEYYNSAPNYGYVDSGENFDGKKTGLFIMVGTYAATTILGAVWSGLTVADHNETLRKNVESTAQNAPKPRVGYDGDNGYFGMAWDF